MYVLLLKQWLSSCIIAEFQCKKKKKKLWNQALAVWNWGTDTKTPFVALRIHIVSGFWFQTLIDAEVKISLIQDKHTIKQQQANKCSLYYFFERIFSLTLTRVIVTNTCCAAQHCSNPQNSILTSSQGPVDSRDIKHVKLNCGKMCLKWQDSLKISIWCYGGAMKTWWFE